VRDLFTELRVASVFNIPDCLTLAHIDTEQGTSTEHRVSLTEQGTCTEHGVTPTLLETTKLDQSAVEAPQVTKCKNISIPRYIEGDITLGDTDLVIGSYFDSPHNFYVQLVENLSILDLMTKNIYTRYSKKAGKGSHELVLPKEVFSSFTAPVAGVRGRPCVLFCVPPVCVVHKTKSRRKNWHRCEMLSIAGDFVKVRLVDFGDVISVSTHQVSGLYDILSIVISICGVYQG